MLTTPQACSSGPNSPGTEFRLKIVSRRAVRSRCPAALDPALHTIPLDTLKAIDHFSATARTTESVIMVNTTGPSDTFVAGITFRFLQPEQRLPKSHRAPKGSRRDD
jgi:hypothetical protein